MTDKETDDHDCSEQSYDDNVVIPLERFKEMKSAETLIYFLVELGVEQWEGFDEAQGKAWAWESLAEEEGYPRMRHQHLWTLKTSAALTATRTL